jgi:hypothetical protein
MAQVAAGGTDAEIETCATINNEWGDRSPVPAFSKRLLQLYRSRKIRPLSTC